MVNGMEWYEWEAGEVDNEPPCLTCSDCPPDDCTGHCCSCPYGAQ